MKKTSSRIVFFGNERLATGVTTNTPVLEALISDGYEVSAVVINSTEPTSRKAQLQEIVDLAEKNNIPVIVAPQKLTDIKAQIKALGAEAGVLAAFGKMVPDEIINLFPNGIINIHPSLLPEHRGPTPIESVILAGADQTGVSIMQLVKAMDGGPVYVQEQVALTGKETKQELANTLSEIGAKLLIKNLPAILSKKLKPLPQDETKATYDQLITKLDGAIDWNMRAETIERQIRAYAGWPGSRSEILGKEVQIIEAELIDKTGVPGEVISFEKQLVACCGEKAINILKIKPSGKKEMSGQAFLLGYGKKLKS